MIFVNFIATFPPRRNKSLALLTLCILMCGDLLMTLHTGLCGL